ncbi:uncharacterized protein LOC144630389 [Oculina patagonica]
MASNANDPRCTARIEARTDLLRQRRKLRQSILARKDDETVERLLRQLADHWGTSEDIHYENATHPTDEEFDLLENGKEKLDKLIIEALTDARNYIDEKTMPNKNARAIEHQDLLILLEKERSTNSICGIHKNGYYTEVTASHTRHAALSDEMKYEKVGNIHLENIKSLHGQKQCEKEDSKNSEKYLQEIPKYDNAREVTEKVIATERNKQEMSLIPMENEKEKIIPKNTLVETDKQPKEKMKEILLLPQEKDEIKYNNIMKGCAQEDSFMRKDGSFNDTFSKGSRSEITKKTSKSMSMRVHRTKRITGFKRKIPTIFKECMVFRFMGKWTRRKRNRVTMMYSDETPRTKRGRPPE